ncbi:MAG: hypothetical protein EBS12_02860 [Flavobacteriia bacterium]|nr:hypothetical protein [Flavobacteriia bacterium]
MLSSCSEKVKLVGDFEETVVVYGLLDQADSLHYIKINRAFIGPGNALEIAQIADSSYFTNVDATISEYLNGNLTRSWLLRDTILDNKDTSGVFYAPEQKVYYFKTLPTAFNDAIQTSTNPQMNSLNPQANYKIDIVLNDGEFSVSGETDLVRGITSSAATQNFNFKFANNPGEYISTGITVSSTGNSYVLNTQMKIAFNEWENATYAEKSFFWALGEADVQPNSSKIFTANGETFYDLMKSKCTENSAITKRTFQGVTIKITGGAEELYNYIAVNKPSSGLAQSKPSYTNLSVSNGKRVIGIFSSRQTVEIYHPFYVSPQQAYLRALDKKSTRELCIGSKTGLYLFCSNHPGDNIVNQEESYACQ